MIGNQFYIGVGVEEITAPMELQALTNTLWLKGGPALYPNLLTNGSFEVPIVPNAEAGNLLIDGSFEGTGVDWTFLNGATADYYQDLPDHNASAHTGKYYVILDHNTEEIYQEVSVSPGVAYVASLYCARESGAFASTGNLIVEGRNGSGAVVESYTQPLAPASTSWTGGQASTVLPGTAIQLPVTFVSSTITHARIRVVATNGSNTQGLLIDDVLFATVGGVGQLGWGTHLEVPGNSANAVDSIDWVNPQAAWDGAYGVRINVTAGTGHGVYVAPLPEPGVFGGIEFEAGGYQLKPTPQMDLRIGVRVRMSPGLASGAGSVAIEYRSHAGDGHENQFVTTGPISVANDGNWHWIHNDITVNGDTTIAITQLAMLVSGWYDIDGWSARDAAANDGGDVNGGVVQATAGYLRGTDFECCLDVANPNVIAAGLTSQAQLSINIYGRREAVVENTEITFLDAQAYSWIANWLNQYAVLLGRTRVKLVDEQVQTPNPGNASLIRVSGSANDIPDQYSTKTTYSWTGKLGVEIELTTQKPTIDKMLMSLVKAASGGGTTSATGAALASSSSGTSTGGSSAPIPVPWVDTFTSSGTSGVFTLTNAPWQNMVSVYTSDGLKIANSNVAVIGTSVTLNFAPPSGSVMDFVYSYTPISS